MPDDDQIIEIKDDKKLKCEVPSKDNLNAREEGNKNLEQQDKSRGRLDSAALRSSQKSGIITTEHSPVKQILDVRTMESEPPLKQELDNNRVA